MKNIARLALIKDDVDAITKRWKALGGYSAPPQASDAYQKELKLLFEKNNCNPMTSMIGIFVQVCIDKSHVTLKKSLLINVSFLGPSIHQFLLSFEAYVGKLSFIQDWWGTLVHGSFCDRSNVLASRGVSPHNALIY